MKLTQILSAILLTKIPINIQGPLKSFIVMLLSSFHLLPYKVQWQRKQTRYLSSPKNAETCEKYNVSTKVTFIGKLFH